MEHDKYEISFQIISLAGSARCDASEAIDCAKIQKYDEAFAHIRQAKNFLSQAHHLQTAMITNEARGQAVDINIIVIHSQDHLIMAMMAVDNAEELIEIYSEMQKIRKDL